MEPSITTSIHPRHADRRRITEHAGIAKRYGPSAREVFAHRNAERIAELEAAS